LQACGPHFCIGANPHKTNSYAPWRGSKQLVATIAQGFFTLARCCCMLRYQSYPIVAAVHGHTVGGGVALCLNACILLCDERTTFEHGNLPRGVLKRGCFEHEFHAQPSCEPLRDPSRCLCRRLSNC
jgi:enoyl-CoA hydratase/carnithine racemase